MQKHQPVHLKDIFLKKKPNHHVHTIASHLVISTKVEDRVEKSHPSMRHI